MFNTMTFDLIKLILNEEAYAAFDKWMAHQTVAIIDGQQYVYAHDFECWLKQSLASGWIAATDQLASDWD
jgi:hypothetical protein